VKHRKSWLPKRYFEAESLKEILADEEESGTRRALY
jgi:hypothetical protein